MTGALLRPLLLCCVGWWLCILAHGQDSMLNVRVPSRYPARMATIVREAYQEIAPRLQKQLGITLSQPASVVICMSHEGLEDLAGCKLPPWALGLALPHLYTIGIDGSKVGIVSNTLASVIRHEACHLYLGAWEKKHARRLPLWFNEGISEWFSEAMHFTYQEQMFNTVAFDRVIPLRKIEHEFPEETELALQSYLQSLSIIEYIHATYGERSLAKILHSYSDSDTFAQAVHKALGIELDELEKAWKKSIGADSVFAWLWKMSTLFSLFFIVALLVVLAFWRQRRRNRRLLMRWEQEEMAAQVARELQRLEMEKRATPASGTLLTLPTASAPDVPADEDVPQHQRPSDRQGTILRFPRWRRQQREHDEEE